MILLAGEVTKGQVVALILLCVVLFLFIVFDIYLVLSLRRKNKKLVRRSDVVSDDESGTSILEDKTDASETENL